MRSQSSSLLWFAARQKNDSKVRWNLQRFCSLSIALPWAYFGHEQGYALSHKSPGGGREQAVFHCWPPIPTAEASSFAKPVRIALWVYNKRFVFHPVPCPWRECTLITVPGTNCEGNQLYRRMESMEARGPQHPEEKGGAIRGYDSREDSRLPFLKNSQNGMLNSSTGISEF